MKNPRPGFSLAAAPRGAQKAAFRPTEAAFVHGFEKQHVNDAARVIARSTADPRKPRQNGFAPRRPAHWNAQSRVRFFRVPLSLLESKTAPFLLQTIPLRLSPFFLFQTGRAFTQRFREPTVPMAREDDRGTGWRQIALQDFQAIAFRRHRTPDFYVADARPMRGRSPEPNQAGLG